jgi:hypothetical protein
MRSYLIRLSAAGAFGAIRSASAGREENEISDLDVSELMVIGILDKPMEEGTMRCPSWPAVRNDLR